MISAEAAIERLCDPAAEVSAHYLIASNGSVTQMVDEAHRAWHAGAGEWRGQDDINSRSIGIELDNTGIHPFSEPQMASLEVLLGQVLQRWGIPPEGVIGHSDMAPGRKIDPGPHFDWPRLARSDLAAPAVQGQAPAEVDPSQFRKLAKAVGYTANCNDTDLLHAVRLRHRPFASGPLTREDLAVLLP